MTAEIVNLNKVRKARAREQERREAEINREKFGRSKAERSETAAIEAARERQLNGAEVSRDAAIDKDDSNLDPGTVS